MTTFLIIFFGALFLNLVIVGACRLYYTLKRDKVKDIYSDEPWPHQ